MTREEQIKEYCASQGFPYGACSGISNVCANVATDAIKWADKTMIDKACSILEDMTEGRLGKRFISEFKNKLKYGVLERH